jgi:hypothetical protein
MSSCGSADQSTGTASRRGTAAKPTHAAEPPDHTRGSGVSPRLTETDCRRGASRPCGENSTRFRSLTLAAARTLDGQRREAQLDGKIGRRHDLEAPDLSETAVVPIG